MKISVIYQDLDWLYVISRTNPWLTIYDITRLDQLALMTHKWMSTTPFHQATTTGHIGGVSQQFENCPRLSCANRQLSLPINTTLLLPKILGRKKRKRQANFGKNFSSSHSLKSEPTLALPNWKFSFSIFNLAFHDLNFNKGFQEKWWRNLAPNSRAKFGFVKQEGAASFQSNFWCAKAVFGARRTLEGRAQVWRKISTNSEFSGAKIRT